MRERPATPTHPHAAPPRTHREMGMFRRTALVCLLAGSALNVLIAWLMAVITQAAPPGGLGGGSWGPRVAAPALETWWQAERRGAAPTPEHHFARAWTFGYTEVVAGRDPATGRWLVLQTVEAGWPNRALRGESWRWQSQPYVISNQPPVVFRFKLLPLTPTIGFTRNLLTFAALPFVSIALLYCIDAARRQARARENLRRNCCADCGYDLQGNLAGGCPECGWARG